MASRASEMMIDVASIVTKMLTIKGVYGREMFETWYAMSVLLRNGLDLSPLITHRFGFEDHAAAFETARSGDCGKVLIDWVDPRLT